MVYRYHQMSRWSFKIALQFVARTGERHALPAFWLVGARRFDLQSDQIAIGYSL
jgi:hypothetical protein